MKIRNNHPLLRRREAGSGSGITLLAAWALLAWPLAPTQADVIDDFNDGRKFMLWGIVGHSQWRLEEGQMKLTLPDPGSYAALIYEPMYELADGQPVDFRVDVVSPLGGEGFFLLAAGFPGLFIPKDADRSYLLYVASNEIKLGKHYDGISGTFFTQGVALSSAPKTFSLTLTREGQDIRVGVKCVLRDNPQQAVFSLEVIDRPGVDFSGDYGPPPEGPVNNIILGYGAMAGMQGREMTFDNLACSIDQAPPLLRILGGGATQPTLAWPGRYVALESDSVQGPWRLCPEAAVLGVDEYTATGMADASARYFRLVQGYYSVDSFEGVNRLPWATTSVVPGNTLRPLWATDYPGSRGRIFGAGTRNEDFMLRYDNSFWFTDCVCTVDILDWGDAMEDAGFGILLRARPPHETWYSNTSGLPDDRYAGLVTFKKADNPAESALAITGPGGTVLKAERFPTLNPDRQYRLRFWAVGDQLTLELFDRDNLGTPIRPPLTATDGRIPNGMFGLCGTKSAGGTYEVWIDRLMLTGATLY